MRFIVKCHIQYCSIYSFPGNVTSERFNHLRSRNFRTYIKYADFSTTITEGKMNSRRRENVCSAIKRLKQQRRRTIILCISQKILYFILLQSFPIIVCIEFIWIIRQTRDTAPMPYRRLRTLQFWVLILKRRIPLLFYRSNYYFYIFNSKFYSVVLYVNVLLAMCENNNRIKT